MRPVILADLEAVASVLLAAPKEHWRPLALAIIEAARIADKYRKNTGKRHPHWGNGSLCDAVQTRTRADLPRPGDPAYLSAVQCVVSAVLERRDHNFR